MNIFPGFGGGPPAPPPLPPPPPPPPERTDPAVEAAKKDLKASLARRRGRSGSILTQNTQSNGSILGTEASGDGDNTTLG
tara:strand:+ start:1484 stop:1723 length:240 start_codon:yes stop_codon:yes gene_type:complete